MAKTNEQAEPFIPLTRALERMKRTFPESSESAIREAVTKGEIFSRRSSNKPKARYSVQYDALVNWYLNIPQNKAALA